MKILFVGDIEEEGKHEAPLLVASRLFDSLIKKDHQVKYFTYFKEGSQYSYIKKFFGTEVIKKDNVIVKYGLMPFLYNVLKLKPDVIYLTNIEFFYIILFPLKYIMKFKMVYTVHGVIHYELKYFRKTGKIISLKIKTIEGLIFRYCDKILFLSEKMSRLAGIYFKVKYKQRVIVDNGIISDDHFKVYNNVLNNKIKLAFITAVVNSERKEKGFDLLIDYLHTDNKNYEVNYYGYGRKHSEVSGNVIINYHPFFDESSLSEALLTNDLFIAPSRCESFNMSLLKAMGLGMIFLASDRVGLTERFNDTLKQFIYRYNKKEDFICKLNSILKMDVEELKHFSSYIRKFALQFTWEKVTDNYSDIFNEIRDKK